jgi:dienelactone hydrolase
MRIITCFLFLVGLLLPATGQKKVSFKATDGLSVTADLYLKNPEQPFILLFHQSNYSRGEFNEIAPKLLNLNYNCLSVDLRSGGEVNFVENETALQANQEKIQHGMLDAKADIQAAIEYAGKFNDHPVILFGSSYSASLSLIIANGNSNVKAVIAFSPGEYFRPRLIVKEVLKGFDKKVFVASTHAEYNYLIKMLDEIPENEKTLFTPENSQGTHGAKALWESSDASQEYWLALFMFFKRLNGTGIEPEKSTP